MAAERAKLLVAKEYGMLSSGIVVLSSRGCTASRGVVTAIGEISPRVLDVWLKCRVCNQCNVMEERKQNGLVTAVEYLDWFVVDEPNCLKNNFSSPQDSIYTSKVICNISKFYHGHTSKQTNNTII